MTNEQTLATRVANQRVRVENYRRILKEYQSGRWYHVYQNTLEELEAELETLEGLYSLEVKNESQSEGLNPE